MRERAATLAALLAGSVILIACAAFAWWRSAH
jgi:hypothetical protein